MNIRRLLERLYPLPAKLVGVIGLLLFLIMGGAIYGIIYLAKIVVESLVS